MHLHSIEHLDLGGWSPVEGYVTIHLSSGELYGLPHVPKITTQQVFDVKTKDAASRISDSPVTRRLIKLRYSAGSAGGRLRGARGQSQPFPGTFSVGPRAQASFVNVIASCGRGGVARVSCPDLRKYARAYVSRDEQFFKQTAVLAFCRYQNLETFGDRFISKAYDNDNGHQWFYDAESIIHLLKRAGFTRVEERSIHQSALPAIQEIEPPRAREFLR